MSTGRPKASSRATLAEAACELFLERGFAQTSIADIAGRAGVSRSSFFNYFGSKADILWAGLDDRIAHLESALASGTGVRAALTALGSGFAPDSLALALVNADAMGLADELARESAWRRARIAAAVSARARSDGAAPVAADVAGAAHGGAVLAAVEEWARQGAGQTALGQLLSAALDAAAPTLPGPVRQLRDRAETDGDAPSEPIRIALEVDDTA